jgi:transmembrane sensor
MNSPNHNARDLITEEAAEWFVANREGLTSQEREAFVGWLRTSPVHIEEYLAHSVIARDLRHACEYSQDELAALVARARTQPETIALSPGARRTGDLTPERIPFWKPAAVTAVGCAMAGIAWVALHGVWATQFLNPPAATADIHLSTRHGEQRSLRLADNSVLHLNTDSAATIRYSGKERLVILDSGEADFEVFHESGRPFHVLAGTANISDLGTQFDVLLGRDNTVVTVVTGNVTISPTSAGGLDVAVGGGQQITLIDGVWPPAHPVTVDAGHATAWLHRQIVFDHEPLDKVASEFNRYALKPIEIVTPGLRKLEISGVFTTDDPTAFIAFLRSLDNVRVEETATQIRVSGDPK